MQHEGKTRESRSPEELLRKIGQSLDRAQSSAEQSLSELARLSDECGDFPRWQSILREHAHALSIVANHLKSLRPRL